MLNDLQAKTRGIIEVERIEGKFKKLALEEADWLIGWAKETGQPDDVIDQLMAVRGRIVRLMIIEGLIPAPTLEERVKGRIAFQLERLGRNLEEGSEARKLVGLLRLKLDALREVEDVEARLKQLAAEELEMLIGAARESDESDTVIDTLMKALETTKLLIELERRKGDPNFVSGPVELLVSSQASDSVVRYDGFTGDFIDVFVPAGTGGMSVPHSVTFGPDGNIYVTNRNVSSVQRFDSATGAFIDDFVPAGSGGLGDPHSLVFGPDGNLYVNSRGTNNVLRYDGTTGAFIGDFVTTGSGGLDGPHGLAFGPDGNLYVSSTRNDSVIRYDGTTGAFIAVLDSAGDGGLDAPTGLAFGSGGSIYVSSLTSSPSEDYLTVLAGRRQWIATTNFTGCPSGPPDSFANSAVLTTSAKFLMRWAGPSARAFLCRLTPKRNSLSRLWPVQISDHSPFTFYSPRSRNCRNPLPCPA